MKKCCLNCIIKRLGAENQKTKYDDDDDDDDDDESMYQELTNSLSISFIL